MKFLEIDNTVQPPRLRILEEDENYLRSDSAIHQFKAWAGTSHPGDVFVVRADLYFVRLKSVTHCQSC